MTILKPDVTIWEKTHDKFYIFELTCPLDRNNDTRHLENSYKDAHFLTDIKNISTTELLR